MKQKECKAGEWTTIIKNFGTGYARTFEVSLAAINEGEEIAGEFEETPYFWIFAEKPRRGELSSSMQFHRKWINGRYKVRLKPSIDIRVSIK